MPSRKRRDGENDAHRHFPGSTAAQPYCEGSSAVSCCPASRDGRAGIRIDPAGQVGWLQAGGISALTLAIVLGMGVGNTVYPRIGAAAGAGVTFSRPTCCAWASSCTACA